jgi:hypothetical protein
MFAMAYRIRVMHAGHPLPDLDTRTDSERTAARAVLDIVDMYGATTAGAPNVGLIPREGAPLVGREAQRWAERVLIA